MQRIGRGLAPHTLLLISVGLLLIGWAIAPAAASADTISSQTAQVLPPGGATCPQITASNLTPYIYNGALDSFEFTISDPSYVALAGSVGGEGIPFNLMTRMGAPGGLKIHVDIATTPITGTLPLNVTLLSARGAGAPVCLTTVAMTVVTGPIQSGPAAPPTSGSYTPTQTQTGGGTGAARGSASTGNTTSGAGAASTVSAEKSMGSSGNELASKAALAVGSLMSLTERACATPRSAERTWLILLLAYLVIVGAALWAEFPAGVSPMRTPERVAAIILVLLLLLLAFWYFSLQCRTALWMPLVAVLIAVLGLLAAFRNHPRITKLLATPQNPSA